MELQTELTTWESLAPEEKKQKLFMKQKSILEEFLGHGAISKAQYEKSLHDLREKMGYANL